MFGTPQSGKQFASPLPRKFRQGITALVVVAMTAFLACSGGGGSDKGGTSGSAPTISSFTANPATINSGQTTTLSWTVADATSLHIDPGNNDVTGYTSATASNLTQTTTFTLTATNASGSSTASTTVTVNPLSTGDSATGSVNTNTSGTITTPLGAKLYVPIYAVPPTQSGGTGTMTFSIEKTTASVPTLPTGETATTDVYRMGPEGFTLARPVMLTLPVSGNRQSNTVHLYRVDPTTNTAVLMPSTYNPANNTVSGTTTKFSLWFPTYEAVSSTADGAVSVMNSSSNYWMNLCITNYTLDYPSQYPSLISGWGGEIGWAPSSDPYWANPGKWFLPQGTYTICVEMSTIGTLLSPPGPPVHWTLPTILQIHQPSTNANGWLTSGNITYGAPATNAVPGPCPCTPTATPTAGTGDVQVTLTWGDAAPGVDLDLHVIEPSGEECYWAHTTTATNGQLDRDNQCANYVDGRPENIFWPTGVAPHGSYKVRVYCFSGCGSNPPSSQSYTVRVINKGTTSTYTGTIAVNSSNAYQDVATFTVN